ncbi:MAG TPA: glycerol kinase GlpK [Acidimicrobiales bacterium]|nr:glycerol kinase GlpK [Acidimicrobiales bacterium]
MATHLLAVDEGTTQVTVVVVDASGAVVGGRSGELHPEYPRPGWVEQDPLEIWDVVAGLLPAVLHEAGLGKADVAGLGITNQRETVVLWERSTGRPVHPAIVWQDRRSADLCRRLKARGLEERVAQRTGLLLDPYFSATKVAWLLDHDPELRRRCARGEICFGTIDSWLIFKLTGGNAHVTEATNASRTLLMDLATLRFEDELLDIFGIDRSMLPEIKPSGSYFGEVSASIGAVGHIAITGVLGDQQSALFAQGCHRPGEAKNTYGTGSFVLANTGAEPPTERGDLLATVALGRQHSADYALEGSIFATGSAVQWLRDGLGVIAHAKETEALAGSLSGNDDVWFVPALAGLGAPYWDPGARGVLIGITRGTTRAHVVRAVLESIALRTRDVLEEMKRLKRPVTELRVDGGAAANDWLMQFQSDVTGIPVEVAAVRETTSLGAAYLAGITAGIWSGIEQVDRLRKGGRRFEPHWTEIERDELYSRWTKAVDRSRNWVDPD